MTRNEFTRQVEQLQGTLYRIAATVLVQPCDREDAVQSAILKAWQHLPRLREDDRFSPWLIRIMLNECYALLRRRKREIPVDTLPELPVPEAGDPDLYRFFVNLPDKLRMVMVLHYVEGYPVREIAQILHLPQGTVKSRLARGREQMRRNDYFKEVQGL